MYVRVFFNRYNAIKKLPGVTSHDLSSIATTVPRSSAALLRASWSKAKRNRTKPPQTILEQLPIFAGGGLCMELMEEFLDSRDIARLASSCTCLHQAAQWTIGDALEGEDGQDLYIRNPRTGIWNDEAYLSFPLTQWERETVVA